MARSPRSLERAEVLRSQFGGEFTSYLAALECGELDGCSTGGLDSGGSVQEALEQSRSVISLDEWDGQFGGYDFVSRSKGNSVHEGHQQRALADHEATAATGFAFQGLLSVRGAMTTNLERIQRFPKLDLNAISPMASPSPHRTPTSSVGVGSSRTSGSTSSRTFASPRPANHSGLNTSSRLVARLLLKARSPAKSSQEVGLGGAASTFTRSMHSHLFDPLQAADGFSWRLQKHP